MGTILKYFPLKDSLKFIKSKNYVLHKETRWCSTSYQNISKLLIANRGEIACRIMKTAKKMGIETIAVYSEVDAKSMHVQMADEAYCIGPAASQDSYLRHDRIISIAKNIGVHAIHPGYGFLSENYEFADLCKSQNIIFVGPPSSAIKDMGIKSTSKHIMSSAGVPIIEGYHGEEQSDEALLKHAKSIGFPIMIKAVRGGGGKGMRIAMKQEEFLEQLKSAKREAMKSFGDEIMLIEKYVDKPRHVEVQIFGDHYGNYVYLFERDCSVQRRHQKIIEEAPAPGLSNETRKAIGEAAVRAAKAVNYVGAGTVEFIMDSNEKFYFMEMNTRLQVEHPVTEMITNTDLVEWQIKVASGERLPLLQDNLKINGHAFEARIYAEDPNNNFMPGAGPIKFLETPIVDEHIRIETGVRQGDDVSVHYDPMIAKLVVWSYNRNNALSKLIYCLRQYKITGFANNIKFLENLASHAEFRAGNVDTNFIAKHNNSLFPKTVYLDETIGVAALALNIMQSFSQKNDLHNEDNFSPYKSKNIRINHNNTSEICLTNNDMEYNVKIKHTDFNNSLIYIKDSIININAIPTKVDENRIDLTTSIDSKKMNITAVFSPQKIDIFSQNGSNSFDIPLPKFSKASLTGGATSFSAIAPMPGVIENIYVSEGQSVNEGDPLLVMIAMKMEYSIKSPRTGIIKNISHKVGDTVSKGTPLITFQE